MDCGFIAEVVTVEVVRSEGAEGSTGVEELFAATVKLEEGATNDESEAAVAIIAKNTKRNFILEMLKFTKTSLCDRPFDLLSQKEMIKIIRRFATFLIR